MTAREPARKASFAGARLWWEPVMKNALMVVVLGITKFFVMSLLASYPDCRELANVFFMINSITA